MEWAYKLTKEKLDHAGVRSLADHQGFLCRSAKLKSGAWVKNVRRVHVGDVIYAYYVGNNDRIHDVGAYEVVSRDGHKNGHAMGDAVDGTALYIIKNEAFLRNVDRQGVYQPDPILKELTGWLVRGRGKAPKYDASIFPMRATLIEVRKKEDGKLARVVAARASADAEVTDTD